VKKLFAAFIISLLGFWPVVMEAGVTSPAGE
jgi:hypothetical protein